MMNRIPKFSYVVLLLVFTCPLFSCAPQSYEELSEDLLSDDPSRIERAIDALSKNTLSLSRCAAALASRDKNIRDRFYKVLERSGDRGIEVMVGQSDYIKISNDHFNLFVNYFKGKGNPGYQALINTYIQHAMELKSGFEKHIFGAKTMAHLERMTVLGRLIMAMPQMDVSDLSKLLFHPTPGTRVLTAQILCSKHWLPDQGGGMVSGTSQGLEESVHALSIVYYSHLVPISGCKPAERALERVSRLAGANLGVWFDLEQKYPSPSDTKFKVLIAVGNDEVVKFIEEKLRGTKNRFLLPGYLNVLEKIGSPAAKAAKSRLGKAVK